MSEGVRLQKFLSRAGVASRRRSEELIRAGRVRLNGEVVREMGVRIHPRRDEVVVDGRRVQTAPALWIAVHKPEGVVITRSDPEGRRTVYDLLPPSARKLFHVGRLDYGSAGLLLLTNEGEVANRLLHPRYGVDRVYEVEVDGRPTESTLRRLKSGVALEDGTGRAHAVRRIDEVDGGGSRLRITLREGRNREVRRMLEAVGHPVRRLVRVRYGPIRLGDLPSGRWRRLTPAEIATLRATGRDSAGP
ncbi:MAG: pseudouridine synthase [Longimicrobiales bacterium]